MATDPPPRLVIIALVIALAVYVTSATAMKLLPVSGGNGSHAIPKLLPVSGGNGSDAIPKLLPVSGGNGSHAIPKLLPVSGGNESHAIPKLLPVSGGNGSHAVPKLLPVSGGNGSHAIPKLLPVSGSNGSDAGGAKQDTSGPDQQPMVLKAETSDGDEPVFIDFSYADENKVEQRTRNDDPSRYSYTIIDAPRANSPKLIPVDRGNDAENPPEDADEKNRNPIEGSENDGVDSVLQLSLQEQIELEENVPGYHNWPKHIPDHLRPISPFPDDERVIAKGLSFIPGRQTKRDEAFLPSEKFSPPPRAGPYLYPQSFVERDFRVPFY